jgi:hypothetical protein
MGYVAK